MAAVVIAVVVLGGLLAVGAAVVRLAMGSGAGVLVVLVAVGAVLVVAAVALGLLTGVGAGHDDATGTGTGTATATEVSAPAPVDDETPAVEHDPVRLWTGLGVAALLLLVAGLLLRSTDWTPIGPDPWGDGPPPGPGRVGPDPRAAPR